jgi:hypothetical protein
VRWPRCEQEPVIGARPYGADSQAGHEHAGKKCGTTRPVRGAREPPMRMWRRDMSSPCQRWRGRRAVWAAGAWRTENSPVSGRPNRVYNRDTKRS